jgi:hypothetical protein
MKSAGVDRLAFLSSLPPSSFIPAFFATPREFGRGVKTCTCISRLSVECSGYLSYTALETWLTRRGSNPHFSD